jgi:hypothetical protein
MRAFLSIVAIVLFATLVAADQQQQLQQQQMATNPQERYARNRQTMQQLLNDTPQLFQEIISGRLMPGMQNFMSQQFPAPYNMHGHGMGYGMNHLHPGGFHQMTPMSHMQFPTNGFGQSMPNGFGQSMPNGFGQSMPNGAGQSMPNGAGWQPPFQASMGQVQNTPSS